MTHVHFENWFCCFLVESFPLTPTRLNCEAPSLPAMQHSQRSPWEGVVWSTVGWFGALRGQARDNTGKKQHTSEQWLQTHCWGRRSDSKPHRAYQRPITGTRLAPPSGTQHFLSLKTQNQSPEMVTQTIMCCCCCCFFWLQQLSYFKWRIFSLSALNFILIFMYLLAFEIQSPRELTSVNLIDANYFSLIYHLTFWYFYPLSF